MEIEVKERIVQSAREFFSRFGFKKTTMDEIAKNVHKAKGVLYYYFKSKEELFHEALKTELNEVKSTILAKISPNGNSIDNLRAYIIIRSDKLQEASLYHETIKAEINEQYVFVQDILDEFNQFERRTLKEIMESGLAMKTISISSIDSAVDLMMLHLKSMEIPFYVKKEYLKHRSTLIELSDIVTNAMKKGTH